MALSFGNATKMQKAEDRGNCIWSSSTSSLQSNLTAFQMILKILYSSYFYFFGPNLIRNYFTKRKQITEINHSHSSWEDVLSGVTQGSILGPILLNNFLSELFLIGYYIDISNYADDNTVYKKHDTIEDCIVSL